MSAQPRADSAAPPPDDDVETAEDAADMAADLGIDIPPNAVEN